MSSIKTYVKAAAIAVPMMVGGAKASAQTVAKEVRTVPAGETLKVMEQKTSDVKRIVRNYKSRYTASIKNDSIVSSNVSYEETGKALSSDTVVVKTISDCSKTKYTAGAGVVSGKNLPAEGFKLEGKAERNQDAFNVSGIVSKKTFGPKKQEIHVVGDIAYTRSFPIKSVDGLSATGKVGVEGAMIKKDGHDSYGAIYPELRAGMKFNKGFDNNVKIGARVDAGVAQPVYFRTQSIHPSKSIKPVVNVEAEAGYKNVSAFVSGGKDAHMGTNIGGGIRYTF